MRQNETLKPAQLLVIEQLAGGSSVTNAADAANVSRATVHRWMSKDFTFKTELKRSAAGATGGDQ